MDYRVVVTPRAQKAIDRDLGFLATSGAAPDVVDAWSSGLFEAIASLAQFPARCGVIPEQWMFDDELRHLLYGRRQHKRRIIFRIEDSTVLVLEYRHGALPPLSGPQELGVTEPEGL